MWRVFFHLRFLETPTRDDVEKDIKFIIFFDLFFFLIFLKQTAELIKHESCCCWWIESETTKVTDRVFEGRQRFKFEVFLKSNTFYISLFTLETQVSRLDSIQLLTLASWRLAKVKQRLLTIRMKLFREKIAENDVNEKRSWKTSDNLLQLQKVAVNETKVMGTLMR